MKQILKPMMLLAVITVASCSSSDEPINDTVALTKGEENTTFNVTIKYDGITYDVPCSIVNDSLVYLSDEFNYVYVNYIKYNDTLAELVYKGVNGEDIIEYYNSSAELEEVNGIKYFNSEYIEGYTASESRFTNTMEPRAGRAILYDDTNFKDRKLILDIDYDLYLAIPKLRDTDNFNDKTSAIRVFNFLKPDTYYKPSYLNASYSIKGSELRTCLIGFENSNYNDAKNDTDKGNGKVLYCIAEYDASQNVNDAKTASHQDYKLKNIGWNDKLSSVRFKIITVENINSGIYSPHK